MSKQKLTPEQVKTIFKLRRKLSQPKLAVMFAVSQATISYLLNGKKYKSAKA